MAKMALIQREIKRDNLVAKYAKKHAELKAIASDVKRTEEERALVVNARQAVSTICRVLQVADSPGQAGHMALQSHMADFEDALQYAIATLAGADCLVTRNPSDFPKRGKVPVLTPEEFLKTEPA